MIPTYRYELYDGKKVIGIYYINFKLTGKFRYFFIGPSLLKRGKTYEMISVPIGYRMILDNGVDYTIRRFLDVKRKSKRQKKLLIKCCKRTGCFT